MTGQERILAAMEGRPSDQVAWAPNINQWFYANKFLKTLDDEIKHCATPIDVLKHLGAEVLTRWDGQIKGRGFPGEHTVFRTCKLRIEWEGEQPPYPLITAFNTYTKGTKIHRILETPCGELKQTWRFTEESCADFEEAYWWKDYDAEFDAVRCFVEDRSYDYFLDDYEAVKKQIGSDGFVIQEIHENPLKMLHWLCGPERAILLMMDHAEQLKELFRIHTRKTLEFVDGLLQKTDVKHFISNDNLDAMLFPPYFFDEFLTEHYQALSDLIHSKGGYFWVHSCGNNYDIAPFIQKCGIDCMEGLTPPPLGNFPLHEAWERIGPDFVVEGGDTCHQQEYFKPDADQVIRAYVEKLFASMKGNPRFIFSSSCNTSPRTPWRNIVALRDAVRELGTAEAYAAAGSAAAAV